LDSGVVLSWQGLRSKSHEDAIPIIQGLRRRFDLMGVNTAVSFASDLCCTDAALIQRIDCFPNANIKKDPFHFMQLLLATTRGTSHPLFGAFTQQLKKAMYDIQDSTIVYNPPNSNNNPKSVEIKVLKSPTVLKASLTSLLDKWKTHALDVDAGIDKYLLTEKTHNFMATWMVHVEKGCLSDDEQSMANRYYYYYYYYIHS
jgi:hypothetical protein